MNVNNWPYNPILQLITGMEKDVKYTVITYLSFQKIQLKQEQEHPEKHYASGN